MRQGARSSQGNRGTLTVLMSVSVGLNPCLPWQCAHPGLTLPQGIPRELLLTSLGVTNLTPSYSYASVEWALFPVTDTQPAWQVTHAPRVNPLSGTIEPFPHPCLVTVIVADLSFLFLLPKITLLSREGAGILGNMQSWGGDPAGKPTWKPSRMHRYQGGTSSILYNMSNLDSVGRNSGGSPIEVPAEPGDSCWRQQREVTQGGDWQSPFCPIINQVA